MYIARYLAKQESSLFMFIFDPSYKNYYIILINNIKKNNNLELFNDPHVIFMYFFHNIHYWCNGRIMQMVCGVTNL